MLRGLIPASAVGAVVALSLSGAVPLGAISGTGYGYNCGVKGNGYHDHGKVCPNRPFPGKGITEAAGNDDTTIDGNDHTTGGSNAKAETVSIAITTTTEDETVATGGGVTSSSGRGH